MWCESHTRAKTVISRQNTASKPPFCHDATGFRHEINMSFTEDSEVPAKMSPQSDGTSEGQGSKKMTFWTSLSTYAFAIREFIAPTYRPERYYMRGPGPACARRRGTLPLAARASFH
jgi:hypothetical protein